MPDFTVTVDNQPCRPQLLIEDFIGDSNRSKYVVGKNIFSQKLIDNYNICAVIDDFGTELSWYGLPVIKSTQADPNGIVCSTSTAIFPISTIKKLKDGGLSNIFHFLDLTKVTGLSFPFVDRARDDIIEHSDKYSEIYCSLADEKSKRIFSDIINFRFNKNIDYMGAYNVIVREQYFEDFLEYGDKEVFVDAGGFDGLTSCEFIKKCPDYEAVIIFEPSHEQMIKAKQRLSSKRNISYHELGLSDRPGVVRFSGMLGSASKINEHGDIEIEVTTIDKTVFTPITLLKMDIEGSELEAIGGAIEQIATHKPKLAISAYHKPQDIRLIYDAVMAIHSDYRVFFRHYTEGTDESVLFFVP